MKDKRSSLFVFLDSDKEKGFLTFPPVDFFICILFIFVVRVGGNTLRKNVNPQISTVSIGF
jgi:hypothetical protein